MYQRERAYRSIISGVLSEVGKPYGVEVKRTYAEIAAAIGSKESEERDPEEIAAEVIKNAGLGGQ